MNMKKLAPTLLAILLLAGAVLAVHFFQKNSSGEKPAASGASQTASDQLVNTPAGEESQAGRSFWRERCGLCGCPIFLWTNLK